MNQDRKAVEAFTLIEMLVVIAIIGILAVVLGAVVGRAKGTAHRTACINNLRQINLGVRMYVDDSEDTSPESGTHGAADPWAAYKVLVKRYVGGEDTSGRSRLFACPADVFYYDYDTRYSESLHRQSRTDYSSYAFNAGNVPPGSPPGVPPVHPWPGIAGRKLSGIGEPARTVLVAEVPALFPYSWHKREGKSHFNNAWDVVSFVDGHVKYIQMYWNAADVRTGHAEAWHYDPPPNYQYKWSGD
jgi:prepilin-type N-terminal cleavage/methylation domain-containing protein